MGDGGDGVDGADEVVAVVSEGEKLVAVTVRVHLGIEVELVRAEVAKRERPLQPNDLRSNMG